MNIWVNDLLADRLDLVDNAPSDVLISSPFRRIIHKFFGVAAVIYLVKIFQADIGQLSIVYS